jgi:hypothetical protein
MSSTGLEDQLKAGMARVPAQVPAGLARTAYRRYLRRRSTVRAAAAVGTAAIVAGAVIGIGLTRPPGTAGPGPAASAAYVVDRVTQAINALPVDAIMFERTTYQFASQGSRQDSWAAGDEFRSETFTPAGRPDTEFGFVTVHNRLTQTQVSYHNKTWSRSVTMLPRISPSPRASATSSCSNAGFLPDPSPTTTYRTKNGVSVSVVGSVSLMTIGQSALMVEQIRTALACGKLKVAGNGYIDGAPCIKLVEQGDGASLTYWVSRSAYLPVRLVTQFTQWPGPQTEQDDFSWLPPTRANLALVTVAIPPGFRQVAPPEQP